VRSTQPALWLARRGIWAMLALAFVIAFASVFAWVTPVALLLAAGFVAAVAADAALGANVRTLRVTRRRVDYLALGRTAELTYDVVNRTDRPLRVGIYETQVPIFDLARDCTEVVVAPRSLAQASVSLVPNERGLARLGTLYVWAETTLGLVRRRFAVDAAQEAHVYPDLSAVEEYGTLAKRSTLLDLGLRKLRLRGVGNEFESLRDYQHGDAFRLVDWKATARRGRMTVAQYEVERSQNVIIALDCGRLMTPRLGKERKFDYALTAGLSVARVAQFADDHVGLLAFAGHAILDIAPRRGAAHYAALARAAYDLHPVREEPDYETTFSELRRRNPKRSLVVLFTDIFDPVTSGAILAGLGTLVPRHLVICVLMNDAAVEDALAVTPATPAEAYRTSVAMTLSDERAKAMATLRGRGIITLDVPARELTVKLIDAYLDVKSRGLL
jgi:uncharacterized protein (DUF58 family)